MRTVDRRLWVLVCMLGVLYFHTGATARDTTMPLTEARDLFAAGNAFYQNQQYEEARVAYRELLDAGYDVPEVLYNLGTTHARLGSSTLALAHLTRAKSLRPRDSDIRANLAYVKAAAQPVALPGSPVGEEQTADSIWKRIYSWFTAEEWLMICWVGFMVLALGTATILISGSRRIAAAGRAMALVGLVCVALLAVPTVAQVYASKIRKMAMVVERADMLSGPAPRFTRINSLDEGQRLRVLRHESDGYVRVQTADGVTGYVAKDALARI